MSSLKGGKFFMMTPNQDCCLDLIGYCSSPRRPGFNEAEALQSTITGPSKSAFEMGKHSDSFLRVFVRIRPNLARETEANVNRCVHVEDVKDFPRDPPPQRIKVL